MPLDLQPRPITPPTPPRPSLGALLQSSALSSYGGLRYGIPQAIQRMTGDLTEDEDRRFSAQNMAVQERANRMAPGGAAQFSDLALAGGNVGLGRFIAENLAYMTPQMAGSVIGGLATRSPMGAIIGGTPQFAGSNVTRAVQETGGLSEGAAFRSLAAAPAQSALDTAVFGFVPGLRALSPVTAKLSGGFMARTMKAVAGAALTEATTEAAQQVGERFAAGLPLTNADAAREYVQSFATAGIIGGVLGIGGGIRSRTSVDTTPAEEVTDEQLLALPPPTMYVDAAGRAASGGSGLTGLMATPRQSEAPLDLGTTPGVLDVTVPRGLPRPTDFVVGPEGIASTPAQDAADEQAAALSTQLSQMPSGDLKALLERATERSDVDPTIVEAVERELAARGARQQAVAQGGAPASTPQPDIWAGWPEIGKGNQDLKRAQPRDEVEARDLVYDLIFDKQDERKSTQAAAIKLGLLDEGLNPTALANEIAAQKAASAPVINRSIEVEAILRPALANRQAPDDVKALAAAKDDAEFDRMVIKALQGEGTVPETAPETAQAVEPKWTRKGDVQTPSAAMEDIALQRGLLAEVETPGKATGIDYTDRARQIMAEITPPSFEEAATAASKIQIAGVPLTGLQQSAFVDGALGRERGPAAQSVGNLADIGQLMGDAPDVDAAYKAGQQWRADFTKVASTAETLDVMKNPIQITDASRKAGLSGNYTLTDQQQVAQDLGVILSETGLDKSHPAEYAALRDRIAQGVVVSQEQLVQDVRAVRAGLSVAPTPVKPFEFKPVRVDATSRALRGINPLVKAALTEKQIAERRGQGTKAQQRTQTYNLLRDELRAARDGGDIDNKTFIRLKQALDQNDYQAVIQGLPGRQETLRSQFRWSEPNQIEAAGVEYALADKAPTDMQGVLRVLADIAPNQFYRALIDRVSSMVRMLERAGVEFEFQVVNGPYQIAGGAEGITQLQGNRVRLAFNSVDSPGRTGTTFRVILHEMLHGVTVALLDGANRITMPQGQVQDAVKALYSVGNHIVNTLRSRRDAGTMTEAERAFAFNSNAVENIHEIFVWALTNPEFQTWLDTVEYEPNLTFFQKLVEVFRSLLGLPAKYDSALAEIIRVTDSITSATELEVRQALNRSKFMRGTISEEFGSIVGPPTAGQINDRVQQTIQPLLQAAQSTNIVGRIADKVRPFALGWLSLDHITEQMGDVLPGLRVILDAHAKRRATTARLAQLFMGVHQRFEQAKQAYPKLDAAINELMSNAAEFGVDPRKTWDQHTWLHGLKNEADLKQKLRAMTQKYLELKNKGYEHFFDEFLAINESDMLAYRALTFYQLVARDPEYMLGVKGFETNPVSALLNDPTIHENVIQARDYWVRVLKQQIEDAAEYIKTTRGDLITMNRQEQERARLRMTPLEAMIKSAQTALTFDARQPYFHLGRFGNFAVAFNITTPGEKMAPDPKVAQQVAKALMDGGFDNVQVSPDNPGAGVFVRLESKAAQAQLEKIALDLAAKGLVDKSSVKTHKVDSGMFNESASGERSAFVDKLISSVVSSSMFDVDGLDAATAAAVNSWRGRVESGIRQAYLDLLPDNALDKFFIQRKARSGYNKDMVRSQSFRHQAASIALAGMSVVSEISRAVEGMRGTLNEAKSADSKLHDRVDEIHDVIREVLIREAKQSEVEISEPLDYIRAVTNAWFLGMSPAYALTNFTQIPILLWPELAKKGGFVAAAKAIAKVTPDAFAILRETWAEAQKGATKSLVDPNRAEMLISHDVLTRALVGDKTGQARVAALRTVDFMVKMIGSASIDLGGATREQGRVVEGTAGGQAQRWAGASDAALKWASVMGLYSETFGRVVAALAAREVSRGESDADVEAYAKKAVNESMYNYSDTDIARYMSRAGWAGPVTKLVTQFMTYTAKTLEKLYREIHLAIGGNAAAGRFLLAHATALTALAGTMGLPFASLFAGLIESLVDLVDDDDEPYDATAAYRNWLASILGEDVAEVVARGLPRLAGADLSQRIGEQDIVPLVGMLTDHRATKDILAEQALRSYGPAVSMATGWFTGGEKMLSGDYMGGLIDASPTFLRSIAKSYRMTDQGYVDNKGNALPMSPSAASYLWQLIGITPAVRAEYTEALGDQFGRRTSLTREATVIRNRVVKALMEGDNDTARSWLSRAQKFDQDNPSYAVIPDIERSIRRRRREAATAKTFGTPLGVRMSDVQARQLTAYANLD